MYFIIVHLEQGIILINLIHLLQYKLNAIIYTKYSWLYLLLADS